MPKRARLYLMFLVMTATSAFANDDRPIDDAKLLGAVRRGVQIVEKAAKNYPNHRTCFSCHHQTLPMFAMVEARAHGLEIDGGLLEAQAEFGRGQC